MSELLKQVPEPFARFRIDLEWLDTHGWPHAETLLLVSRLFAELERLTASPQDSDVVRAREGMREPTDEMVSVCLQTFRHEMDRHMDLRHPSFSPGHDSMRIALRKALATLSPSPAPNGQNDGGTDGK